MSDTPRTDAVLPSQSFIDETRLFDRHYYLPLIEHARQLERELRPSGPSGELERAVIDAAMKWYHFTLDQGLDGTDYHADSREQWMACQRLAESSPLATTLPLTKEK